MRRNALTLLLIGVMLLVTGCSQPEKTTDTQTSAQAQQNAVPSSEPSKTKAPEPTKQAATKSPEPTKQAEKNSNVPSNFSIEGKWKSVGEYGFGQAQPGAIVVFDGKNCNFFSPKDTYALYKENNQYKLDCTSFMSTDTLSFKVNIIDNDHINILYGDKPTELKRMQ